MCDARALAGLEAMTVAGDVLDHNYKTKASWKNKKILLLTLGKLGSFEPAANALAHVMRCRYEASVCWRELLFGN